MAYSDLSLRDRAEIIRLSVQNGLKSLKDIRDFYNSANQEEHRFDDGGSSKKEDSESRIKNVAYRIMSQQPRESRTMDDIFKAMHESYFNKPYDIGYTGSYYYGDKFGKDAGVIPLDRDANSMFLYGNVKGQYAPITREELRGHSYAPFIRKHYPDKVVRNYRGKFYPIQSVNLPKDIQPLFDFLSQKDYGMYNAPLQATEREHRDAIKRREIVDDVASFRTGVGYSPNGTPEFQLSDLVDFGGGDYRKKWGIIAGIQGAALNKVGNPFMLRQYIPVNFTDNPNDEYNESAIGTLIDIARQHNVANYDKSDNTFHVIGGLPEITVTGNKKAQGGSIHISPSKRGTFTAAATKHGKSVQAFASQVLANKKNYSPAMVKKDNFARNFGGHKGANGLFLNIPTQPQDNTTVSLQVPMAATEYDLSKNENYNQTWDWLSNWFANRQTQLKANINEIRDRPSNRKLGRALTKEYPNWSNLFNSKVYYTGNNDGNIRNVTPIRDAPFDIYEHYLNYAEKDNFNNLGYKALFPSYILLNNNHLPDDDNNSIISTLIHEGTHALIPIAERGNPIDTKRVNLDKSYNNVWDSEYLDTPTEIYSRLMQIRHDLKLNPAEKITKEQIKKWKERDFELKDGDDSFILQNNLESLIDRYDEDTLLYLFNDIAKNNNNKNHIHLASTGGPLYPLTHWHADGGYTEQEFLPSSTIANNPYWLYQTRNGVRSRYKARPGVVNLQNVQDALDSRGGDIQYIWDSPEHETYSAYRRNPAYRAPWVPAERAQSSVRGLTTQTPSIPPINISIPKPKINIGVAQTLRKRPNLNGNWIDAGGESNGAYGYNILHLENSPYYGLNYWSVPGTINGGQGSYSQTDSIVKGLSIDEINERIFDYKNKVGNRGFNPI